MSRNLYLGVPHYGAIEPNTVPGLVQASFSASRVRLRLNGASLLAFNFNLLWCEALNGREQPGFTHFLLHHADIQAPGGFADSLMDEMDRTGADVLSVVVPLKDDRGLTSTGTMPPCPEAQYPVVKRLTMKEVCKLPTTFSANDVKPGHWLAVNTGILLIDLRKAWVDEFPGFNIRDCIVRLPSGQLEPGCLSEDWNASAWAARRGLNVMATRIISVNHHGRQSWSNATAWGQWKTDKGDKAIKKQPRRKPKAKVGV
jgi:hypothetical protein